MRRTLSPLGLLTYIALLIVILVALFYYAETISCQHSPTCTFRDTDNNQGSIASVSPSFFNQLERLARLADISYCVGTSGIYQPFSCASRCDDFPNIRLESTWHTGFLMSDSCGYVAIDYGSQKAKQPPSIIVSFRGTYSLANTVVDLSTVPQEYIPYPEPGNGKGNKTGERQCTNCTVHMGFLESWRQARQYVLPVLNAVRARHPSFLIQLVGHSLGGAVACLAALELRVSLGLGLDQLHVTTFGEPQLGNAGFADYVDGAFGDLGAVDGYEPDVEARSYRRVTHVDDPVPLLPLPEWGYRPHGGEVFITKPLLSPGVEDLRLCRGDADPACIAGAAAGEGWKVSASPSRLRFWQLLFAHRDYFWRVGLCVPGGDPFDWGRPPYNVSLLSTDEL